MPKQQKPLSPTIEEITQVFLPSPARARALISSLAEGDSLEEIEQRVVEHALSLSRYLPGFVDLESCEKRALYYFDVNALFHTALLMKTTKRRWKPKS
ncbi:MAG: hypothetical protein GYA55_10570 [SAR324 cluster bacterium]|uniref:Uncharacterized protein n=1 Tax=SAR324 cluster bacterium TaxID=2024889 RepID=A0A7X9FTN2_9DELT|nr:hypothetical protein [SAR324 cluster bacterium]